MSLLIILNGEVLVGLGKNTLIMNIIKSYIVHLILVISIVLNVLFLTKNNSPILAEDVVFMLNSESINTLVFSSRVLHYLEKGDMILAKEKLNDLIRINLKVMSNRDSGSVLKSQALKEDELNRLLFLYIGLQRTKDNIKELKMDKIKQTIVDLMNSIKLKNPELINDWESQE